MIHMRTFTGYNEEDCIRHINDELDEDQIITIVPRGSKTSEGYDEYDRWTTYYMVVIYKDGIKNNTEI